MTLTYPNNLLYDLFDRDWEYHRPADFDGSLEYVLHTLTEREQRIMGFRYKDGLTFEKIGKHECVTRERIRQICAKALRKLRHPYRLDYLKYGGRCAYCGAKIKIGEMQADHIFSVYHTETGRLCGYDTPTDEQLNSLDNFRPACRQCNYYKSVYDTNSFREAIKEMLWKNLRKTFAYRMALKYGLIEEHDIDIIFYFEKEES